MGICIHWGGTGNGGSGGDWGVYCPPSEHGLIVHFDSSCHGLVSGGRVEDGNAPLHAIVGESHSVYPED